MDDRRHPPVAGKGTDPGVTLFSPLGVMGEPGRQEPTSQKRPPVLPPVASQRPSGLKSAADSLGAGSTLTSSPLRASQTLISPANLDPVATQWPSGLTVALLRSRWPNRAIVRAGCSRSKTRARPREGMTATVRPSRPSHARSKGSGARADMPMVWGGPMRRPSGAGVIGQRCKPLLPEVSRLSPLA
jgi:hypothetical protein